MPLQSGMVDNFIDRKHGREEISYPDVQWQHEAGLPAGAFINLYPTRSQIELILNDPRVHGVALTGSEEAGSVVAAQAGKALKKSTLELGGADAFVVLADADVDKAVKWAVFGRHWNAGQVCVSSKRIIVADEIYDTFLEKYIKGVAALKAGDPMDPATTLAPLSSKHAAELVREKIAKAVAAGAKAQEVGPKVPTKGAFVQPTILTDVSGDNPARLWEFFGPVSMIFRAKSDADAARLANDSPFGLGGSVFSRDDARAKAVAANIETGMLRLKNDISQIDFRAILDLPQLDRCLLMGNSVEDEMAEVDGRKLLFSAIPIHGRNSLRYR